MNQNFKFKSYDEVIVAYNDFLDDTGSDDTVFGVLAFLEENELLSDDFMTLLKLTN